MADKFLNNTGLQYFYNRIKTIFATQTALNTLSGRVDDIISEGGEPNVINTVKVNGVALTPDAQKAVDVTVPVNTSDLINDGDGVTPYATTAVATTSAAGLLSAADKTKLDGVTAEAEPNTIETVKVNGTALVPDAQKAVDVSVPTSTSELTNDSAFPGMAIDDNDKILTLNVTDGENTWDANFHNDATGKTVEFIVTDENGIGDGWTSTLATTAYVQENGGKIDTISVNGTSQTITNKNVNLIVPELVNSTASGFSLQQTNNKVNVAIPSGDNTYVELQSLGSQDAVLFNKHLATVDAIPTNLSALTNDGDGTAGSRYATEAYVTTNGGKIDTISVNNVQQTITNKNVNITVPTTTSALTNDSDFQTETQVQALIDAELAGITSIEFEIVQALPASGVKGTIYLLPNEVSSTDVYDEYIWVTPTGGTAHWEQIGNTAIDLSGYWAKTELVAITTAEIDTILAS